MRLPGGAASVVVAAPTVQRMRVLRVPSRAAPRQGTAAPARPAPRSPGARRPLPLSLPLRLAVLACALVASSVVGAAPAGADAFDPSAGIASASTAGPTDGVSGIPNAPFPDALPTSDLGVTTAIDASNGFLLADSGLSLDQIDPASGAIIGGTLDATQSDSADSTMALAAVGGGLAFDPTVMSQAAAAQQQSQQQADQAKAQAVTPTSQQTVGPDGCPTSAPPNTMRGGASDVAALCAASVAQARSPQAALAIKAALTHLGLTYSQPQRNAPTEYDCASFVTRMYDLAGVNLAPPGQNAPTTFTIASAPWAVHIPYAQGQPGDLAEPGTGHVTMLLADNLLVETSATGDVSHVTSRYFTAPYVTVWIDPSKV